MATCIANGHTGATSNDRARTGKRKRSKAAATQRHYGIRCGRQTGVFDRWADVEPLVRGFAGAEHRAFATAEAARAYVSGHDGNATHGNAAQKPSRKRCKVGVKMSGQPMPVVLVSASINIHAHAIVRGECAVYGLHVNGALVVDNVSAVGVLVHESTSANTRAHHGMVPRAPEAARRLREQSDTFGIIGDLQRRADIYAVLAAMRAVEPTLLAATREIDAARIARADARSAFSSMPTLPTVCIVTASLWALRVVRDYLPEWSLRGYRDSRDKCLADADILLHIGCFMHRFGSVVTLAYSHARTDMDGERHGNSPPRCQTGAWTELDTSASAIAARLSRPLAIARGAALDALPLVVVDDTKHCTDNN